MFGAPVAPDPTDIGSTLVANVGDQVLDTAIGIAPIAVPFVLGLTVVSWALAKFGLLKKGHVKA